jgi:hypothetical protein
MLPRERIESLTIKISLKYLKFLYSRTASFDNLKKKELSMSTPLNTARNDLEIAYTTAKLFCHRCHDPINKPEKVFGDHYKAIYCSQICFNKSKEKDEIKMMEHLKQGKSFKRHDSEHVLTQHQINSIYHAIGKPSPKDDNERSKSNNAI